LRAGASTQAQQSAEAGGEVVTVDDAIDRVGAVYGKSTHTAPSPRLKAILIGSLGNLVEWYDFYVYAAFSLYFASSFFPAGDAVSQQLNAGILFAAGFLMRPIGSFIFGRFADRHGRRNTLLFTVLLMCFGSLMIAVTPTYPSIGVAAPILLGIARLIQGLSLGGEYGISAAYLCEIADEKHRGFYSSFQYVTIIGGQLCAIVVLLILQKLFLTPDQLQAWGWRIPFVIGAALAVAAATMRRDLRETELFIATRKKIAETNTQLRARRELFSHPREMLLVVGLTMGGTAAFYTYTIYMQKFLKLSVKLSDDQTTLVTALSLIFAMILQPIYGSISDSIGRKWLLVGFGGAGTLFTIPLLTALQNANGFLAAFLLIAAGWLIVSGYTATSAVVKAELFPTCIRATGIGVPYALTLATFGGTAEPIALWFKSLGHEDWFYIYLTGCIAVSLTVYLTMRDTMKASAMNRHE
jgi:MHS family alpha-ketoglutarate permease-like MFS transporter